MTIRTLRHFISTKKRQGGRIRVIQCPRSAGELLAGCPFLIDDSINSNVILKEDTLVELGPPSRASCHFILMTQQQSRVRDGRITLIGPDIAETSNTTLPFGQVLVLGGTGLEADHYPGLERCQYIANRLPGYMIRFSPRRMWSRVSHAAGARGFSLEILARNLMALYKEKFPIVEAMEILFITSSDEDVEQLAAVGRQNKRKGSEILRRRYDCAFAWGCDDCPYKTTCARIREMARLSKSMRKRRRGAVENVTEKAGS